MSTSFARRDQLLDIQRRAQSLWESLKVFEVDAPVADAAAVPKFICSFPYPYMNGFLHVGHAFTFSKTEFATGYERLKGKNALFPFGFHCTGMPIQACANKLKAELEQYGNPPNFPVEEESSESKLEAEENLPFARSAFLMTCSPHPLSKSIRYRDEVQSCREDWESEETVGYSGAERNQRIGDSQVCQRSGMASFLPDRGTQGRHSLWRESGLEKKLHHHERQPFL